MFELTKENIPILTLIVSFVGLLLTTYTATINVTRQKKANLEIERIRIKREMKIAAYDRISSSIFKLMHFIQLILSSSLDRKEVKDAEKEFSNLKEVFRSRAYIFKQTFAFEESVRSMESLFQLLESHYHQRVQVIFMKEDVKDIILPAYDNLRYLESDLHRDVFEEINSNSQSVFIKMIKKVLKR
ncbi:hypothetical protein H6F38_14375 [Paenibacillus sp. EKM208P]|nr:hypothetical protein H6F38_14375 [Paenibacillus sp. EKM208P]